ncbi:LD-carboxypeptidase [Eikenella sp. S3360]|uniref:LD-carboxypeptidase n=1 Tax=Eikenella glucosivorans TaxID=2766967 RepID=A0ABS0N9U6_9NEIS|nr:LD-carboxypeptidase [Eikenella glucosivorans]MBH5329074.1 LD-carboxypeptidase [Eikenella glucosivorans]
MLFPHLTRRRFLSASATVAGAGILQACSAPVMPASAGQTAAPGGQAQPRRNGGGTALRVVAPSGFAPRPEQAPAGRRRLYDAGFTITNQQAVERRYQRFAGTDAERIADFQDVASGKAPTPQVLMGMRGGYGAVRILPHIDWASLGARMREQGTLFFGFSDVCAVQLALLAQGNMCSFAGPMLYSGFGKAQPSVYAMQAFIDGSTQADLSIQVSDIQADNVPTLHGTMWGGNLSVIASLAGSAYLPQPEGGILFLEDVGEQPYRLERMLQTLHLAGILKRQQAIVLGNFRMSSARDVYDGGYDLSSVIRTLRRISGIPVLTGFPFGHISDLATFPLGVPTAIRSNGAGGYTARFSGHPTLNPAALTLNNLLPPPPSFDNPAPVEDNSEAGE